jgi:hypothetical protein
MTKTNTPNRMKNQRRFITLAALLLPLAALVTGCGTGTTIIFGPDGIEIVPPAAPIVIPTK